MNTLIWYTLMFAEIIICTDKRKSAACRTFMATPLLTINFFRTDLIKTIREHWLTRMLRITVL
jgi:hypothetical protein